jgi:hypothetical protein
MIASWLREWLVIILNNWHGHWPISNCRGKLNIAMIIHLHCITNNGISASQPKNLWMFMSLCGHRAMPNIVSATTMWGEVKLNNGDWQEAILKSGLWDGCRFKCFWVFPLHMPVSLANNGRIDREGCGVSYPLSLWIKHQWSVIPPSVMGPTGTRKSVVRSHPLIYFPSMLMVASQVYWICYAPRCLNNWS